MERNDKSKYLLYIEPKKEEKLSIPIDDDLTSLMDMALSKSLPGISKYNDINNNGDSWEYRNKILPSFGRKGYWMGHHKTDCGEESTNRDYLLENGMITNSLATFYLRWYRFSIPENDMIKIKELEKFYSK